MRCFIFIILILLCFGCKQKTVSPSWTYLTIVSENRTYINIENGNDSALVKFYHKGTIFEPLKKDEKVKIETSKIGFNKAERDSVFSFVNDLIINPVVPKTHCTEFVGMLELTLVCGQITRSCKYESVCDWTKLSDKTALLGRIFIRKIKAVHYK
jgi:hypothetical protein